MKTGPKRTFCPEKSELESLYQRMTMKAIASHFGVGETAVWNRIKEYGIKLEGVDNPRRRPKAFTAEHLAAIRASAVKRRGKWVGDKNPHWKGGATVANLEMRRTGAYKQWKNESLARAGYKCQDCGAEKGHICECCGQPVVLHVHHVHSFAGHPELRFDSLNSEVLCARCHHSRHRRKIG